MTKVLYGDRIGKQGKIRLGCSAVLFDGSREKVLLTRRADNGQYCLPGGAVEPGESVAEACEREVLEETGPRIRVMQLIGVYSDPNQLVVYPDGNQVQFVVLNFNAEVVGGAVGLSNETIDVGYFSLAEIEVMDLLGHHKQRIQDALIPQEAAIIR